MKTLFYHTDPLEALQRQGVDLSQSVSEAVGGEGGGGDAAPGTGQPPATSTEQPPAEATTTETPAQEGQPPETIPYPRFKEVNDQLREYRDLGDVDSLRQLADWAGEFDQNPVGTWLAVAKEMADQLPQSIRDALAAEASVQTPKPQGNTPPQQPESSNDEPPAWAKPLLEDKEKRDAEVEASARREALNSLLQQWKDADAKDGLKSIPDERMLTFISGNAGVASSMDNLLERARGEWLELRKETLGESVERDESGAPRRVPGSAPPPPQPRKIRSLAEASAEAEAAIKAGNLDTSGVARSQ